MHYEPGAGGGESHLLAWELGLGQRQGQLEEEDSKWGDVLARTVAMHGLVQQVEDQAMSIFWV